MKKLGYKSLCVVVLRDKRLKVNWKQLYYSTKSNEYYIMVMGPNLVISNL